MKLFLILFGAFLLPAQVVHSPLAEPASFKISDRLLLHWNNDAIEAFDWEGVRVLTIDVHRLLPDAATISLDDIAARRNESVAIAAVTRENDGATRAWLLHVAWDAHLSHKTELNAATSLGWLDFDETGNIWGLTDYLGEKVRKDTTYNGVPCPLGPLILVFNPEGRIVKSILKQSDLPDGLREAAAIGQVTFGLTHDQVWFWQPARHRMVIAARESSDFKTISIPHPRASNLGGRTILMPSGEVIQDLHSPTLKARGIYLVKNGRAKKLRQPENARLVGIDGSELVFLGPTSSPGNFLMTHSPGW